MRKAVEELLEWAKEQRQTEDESARRQQGHLQSMAMAAGTAYEEVIEKIEEVLKAEAAKQ